MLTAITLVGDRPGDGETKARVSFKRRPLCSVAITALSGQGWVPRCWSRSPASWVQASSSEWCPKWVSAVVTGAGVGTHVHCDAGWGDLGRVWDLDCTHYKCHGLLPMPCPDTALGSEPPLSLQRGPSLSLCHPCSGVELYHRQARHVLAFYTGPDTGCGGLATDRDEATSPMLPV